MARSSGSFWEEVKRIEWTDRKDLYRYAKIVLGWVFCFGFAVYFIDLLIRKSLFVLDSVLSFIFR